MASDRKSQYLPVDDIEKIERRRSFEEAKEQQEQQINQLLDQNNPNNTAFRRGSTQGTDLDDIFEKEDAASSTADNL